MICFLSKQMMLQDDCLLVFFDYFEDIWTPHMSVAPSMAAEAPASSAGGGDSGCQRGWDGGKDAEPFFQVDRFGIAGSRTKKFMI